MSNNGGSAVGLLSYETLVHAVAGATVRSRDRNESLKPDLYVHVLSVQMIPVFGVG